MLTPGTIIYGEKVEMKKLYVYILSFFFPFLSNGIFLIGNIQKSFTVISSYILNSKVMVNLYNRNNDYIF